MYSCPLGLCTFRSVYLVSFWLNSAELWSCSRIIGFKTWRRYVFVLDLRLLTYLLRKQRNMLGTARRCGVMLNQLAKPWINSYISFQISFFCLTISWLSMTNRLPSLNLSCIARCNEIDFKAVGFWRHGAAFMVEISTFILVSSRNTFNQTSCLNQYPVLYPIIFSIKCQCLFYYHINAVPQRRWTKKL